MRYRYLFAALAIAVLAAWWMLRDDAEARVRSAHAELLHALNKAEDPSDSTISVVELRRLQRLIAENCTVSGDAAPFTGSYSPQELTGLIVSVRGALQRAELEFGELAMEFPEDDVAVTRFSAALEAVDATGEAISEQREVESRMREANGDWRFESFSLRTDSL